MNQRQLNPGLILLGMGTGTVLRDSAGTNASPGPSIDEVIADFQTPGKQGRLFIISGPSGVGKTTIVNRLLVHYNTPPRELVFIVSHTTRPMRPGDENGVDYHFDTEEEFHQVQSIGGFLETAVVHGNFYGTPKKPVMDALQRGADVIVDIDVQGWCRIKRYDFGAGVPQIHSIFIKPETTEQLRMQLLERGDSPDVIARRVTAAEKEIARANEYDHVVISHFGHPDRALAEVMEIFEGIHGSISS